MPAHMSKGCCASSLCCTQVPSVHPSDSPPIRTPVSLLVGRSLRLRPQQFTSLAFIKDKFQYRTRNLSFLRRGASNAYNFFLYKCRLTDTQGTLDLEFSLYSMTHISSLSCLYRAEGGKATDTVAFTCRMATMTGVWPFLFSPLGSAPEEINNLATLHANSARLFSSLGGGRCRSVWSWGSKENPLIR